MVRPRHRVLAAALIAGALWAGGAAAQQAALSPAHMALAREVATVAGSERAVDGLIPEFGEGIRQLATTRPEVAKDIEQVLEAVKPDIDKRRQEFLDSTARLFASRMSEAELREVLGFFRSPTGSKYLQIEPIIGDIVMLDLRKWGQETSAIVSDRVRAELTKRGHQF